MMERERLTHLLKDPGAVAREDLADLRSLAERFPWFSGAHLLRASGEGMAGDVRSEETLSSAAAHVPSRAVLYDLAATRLHEVPLAAPFSVVAKTVVSTPGIIETPALPLAGTLPAPVRPIPRKKEEELQEVEHQASLTVPDEVDVEKLVPSQATAEVEAEDPLERQIMEAALASAYDLTLHAPLQAPVPLANNDPKGTNTTEVASEIRPAEEPVAEEPAAPNAMEEAAPAVEPEVRTGPAIPIAPNTRKRFSSWLDVDGSTSAIKEVVATPKVPSLPPAPPKALEQASSAEKVLAPEERMSIVDRFIGQEIQTPASKTAFFTPQQAAKRSLDDTTGLVTETLAGIYAKQGNTAKAIEAYRKLALKYPEKSAYFAGLSQALEAQQNK
ncbi:MAG: hypothetical protein WEC15_04675 [Flavobacteriales bacterium]